MPKGTLTLYCQHRHSKVAFSDGTPVQCSLFTHIGRHHEDHSHAHSTGEILIWTEPRAYVRRFVFAIGRSYWAWCIQLGESGIVTGYYS